MEEFIVKYWLQFLFVTVSGILVKQVVSIGNQFKKIKCNYTAVEHGVIALLRTEMIKIYNRHCDEKCMPIYAKENFNALYQSYKALGGNGTIDSLHEEVKGWTTRRSDRNETS